MDTSSRNSFWGKIQLFFSPLEQFNRTEQMPIAC
jgi:hypothetical protein